VSEIITSALHCIAFSSGDAMGGDDDKASLVGQKALNLSWMSKVDGVKSVGTYRLGCLDFKGRTSLPAESLAGKQGICSRGRVP
jgi:hypothetical protein